MTTWFTSDPHFGHSNILKYQDRPYRDLAEMNAGLVERWNAQVRPDDNVVTVGDLAMGQLESTFSWLRLLNGHIAVVPGNHDRFHPMYRDTGKKYGLEYWQRRYWDEANVSTILAPEVRMNIGHHIGIKVCHFPYHGDTKDEDRFPEWRPVDNGEWLIHGHVHGSWRQRGRMVNVGMDAWGGVLLSEERLEAFLDTASPTAEHGPLVWR